MKKWLFLFLIIPSICLGQETRQQSSFFPASTNVHLYFDGEWMPDVDSTLIGPKNFKTLQNYRYIGHGRKSVGIKGVLGYDEINQDIVNVNYYKPRSGIHFVKYRPAESHVIVQFYNHDLSRSRLYDNETDIPDEGNFNADYLYQAEPYSESASATGPHQLLWADTWNQDAPNQPITQFYDVASVETGVTTTEWADIGAGVTSSASYTSERSRFSLGPRSHVLHSDGTANHIWQGHETQIAAFMTASAAVTSYVCSPRDYTYEVSNTIDDDDETALLAAYNGTTAYFLVGFTRPASGITPYIKDGDQNDLAGQAVSVEEWTGTRWRGLTTTDDTDGLTTFDGANGIYWGSTVDSSQPIYLAGYLLYFYHLQVPTTGGATLYHISGNVPWQEIKDIWDGVPRTPISVQVTRDDGHTYDDYTLSVQQSYPEYEIGAEIGHAQHMIVVFEDRLQAMEIDMITGNTNAMADYSTVSYWGGTTWVPTSSRYDGTYDDGLGITPFARTGPITWTPPSRALEFKKEAFGVFGYAYKIAWNDRISRDVTVGGIAEDDSAIIDTIYGIPAPLKVPPFKFVSLYANRAMLVGYLKGNEANRVDYSAVNAPDVYNGYDSSYGGSQSLYFGKGAELTAAQTIFNRYGSDVEAFWVVFTDDETFVLRGNQPDSSQDDYFKIEEVSSTYGCPAPFTLTRADMGFEIIEGELERNVLIWLAADGPKMFDGLTPKPILGIDSYFDENDSNYVGADEIENASAWFDPNHKEWNLKVGDYWFVYDLVKKRWFEKDTGSEEEPIIGIPVIDTSGNEYIYGGLDNGFVARLEYGPTWSDGGSAISHVWETGDFYADGLGWNETVIGRARLEHRAIDEDTTMYIQHFKDAYDTGTSVFSIPLSVAENSYTDLVRTVWALNKKARYHRFKGTVETDETTDGLSPNAWGFQYNLFSEDR